MCVRKGHARTQQKTERGLGEVNSAGLDLAASRAVRDGLLLRHPVSGNLIHCQ